MKDRVPIAIGVAIALLVCACVATFALLQEEEKVPIEEHELDQDDVNVTIEGDSVIITEYHGKDCNNLVIKSVKINEKIYPVKKIGENAFSHKSGLTGTLTLGEGLEEIGDSSFNRTGFVGVSFPESLEKIGKMAFANSRIRSDVSIPENVLSIGDGAFSGTNATGFFVDEKNPHYSSLDGSLYNKNKSMLVAVTNGINFDFEALPNTVTQIGPYCFYNYDCHINTSVVDLSNVTMLGECCFCDARIDATLILSDKTIEIGNSAFNGCSMYGDITIPSTVKCVGDEAFMNFMVFMKRCPYKLTIENGVQKIGDNAFDYSGFSGELVVPFSVTSIGNLAFHECHNLSNIQINGGCTIGNYAFYRCINATGAEISGAGTVIGDYAFRGCAKLYSLDIGAGVASIGDYAFYKCAGLKEIQIGANVGSIGDCAFRGCTGMNGKTIIFYQTSKPTLGHNSFALSDVEDPVPISVTFAGYEWVSAETFTKDVIGDETTVTYQRLISSVTNR